MNSKSKLILLALVPLSLASCGEVKPCLSHLEDYAFEMAYHDDFNILQLTDIHWNYNTSTIKSKVYLDKVFEATTKHIREAQGPDARIDLVEITGDQFMLANAYHVDSFIEYFEAQAEKYGFKYAVIWGNHDHHGIYNPNWLSDRFLKAPHAIFYDANDDLYGRSNFVINLTEDGSENTETFWQLANIDSGASFSERALSISRDYDYIRPEQTRWWLAEHNRVGADVPTIAYYHIPQEENLQAWNAIHDQGATYRHKFFKLEGFADNGDPRYASDFIDVGRLNNLKAAFMGHAHNVDWTVDYDGVVIGLGVKTGTELYYAHIDVNSDDPAMKEGLASVGIDENFDLIGASLVTLTDTAGSFDLEHLYLNERASGDFVRWVKW
ncbi:MAG: hypothetical protein E7182_00045 [Erysipelotrichaceae bacterium]|nr:hypothetical protein [Erysipelotrichaceae bacterium]